jgi:hypothetical protein
MEAASVGGLFHFRRGAKDDGEVGWSSFYLDAEHDEAEQEGGIEVEPHDADTEQDGDAECETPFMFGGNPR